jgi:hypothetical protein
MFLYGKRTLSLLPLLLISFLVLSQEVEPYSRFGLGNVDNSVFSAQRAVGGFAAPYRDPFYINYMNPASYTSLALTTFEAGVKFSTKNIEDGQTGKRYTAGDGFLDYLALAFPIKRSGLSVGLVPYSDMRYSFIQSRIYDVGSARKLFEGDGRIYQLYAGTAYRFQKLDTVRNSLSIGVNLVYLFGNLERGDLLQFSPFDYYNARITSSARLKNLALNVGLQYKRRFNNKVYGLIGGYAYFPVKVYSREEETWETYIRRTSFPFTVTIDKVYENERAAPDVKIPVETGIGVSFGQPTRWGEVGKWMIGGEFKYKLWSDVESFSPDAEMVNSWEVRAGGEFRPATNWVGTPGLLKRMAYRIGGFYDSGYLSFDGTKITEAGVTFGFAIPVRLAASKLNFSFDTGSRGTTSNELIKEFFFRAHIGFTFNEKWFTKPKYD